MLTTMVIVKTQLYNNKDKGRGRPRVPPSGGGPVSPRPARTPDPPRGAPTLTHPRIQNLFCFKLDAKSVPEALATTFLILEMFSIALAHRYPGHRWAPQDRPRTPFPHFPAHLKFKKYFALNSTPSPSQKLSPPRFESWRSSLSI